ncbi:unnamed protein product [Lymnaea stagnalis]|uniref:Caspase-3 n=1 Tax=Lymnaea stagnalis TaxID=6523 RepID=A0AAV2HFR5_LYMST
MSSRTQDLQYYRMDYPKRGTAVIINNETFLRCDLSDRDGSEVDAERMERLFKSMGFEKILRRDNLTADEIRRELDEGKTWQDHSESSCFVCVLLSHGDHEYVYGTDEGIEVSEIFQPFRGNNCRSLVGKPKLFFIQACRGELDDDGADVVDAAIMEPRDTVVRRIPSDADFFIAYSVVQGYASWRHTELGSWFIQAVVKIFQENWRRLDLLTMMTRVNRMVAYEFESNTGDAKSHRKKQMPCVTSMLTKDVYFLA